MNLIQAEMRDAKSKMLTMLPGTELVELSHDNVAKVEAMIGNDSAYLNSGNPKAAPRKNNNGDLVYGGSTAYWMTRLKDAVFATSLPSDYEEIIVGAVSAVDRENSTHLNADGVGREEITERIKKLRRDQLIEFLRCPLETDYALIRILADRTHPNGVSAKGRAYKPRENISFASKFCHYACFYLFEGKKEQDNFSIYDTILKKAIPLYMDYYSIEPADLRDYSVYSATIREILDRSGARISRNGFDHLLWYYFKGRI